MRGTFRAYIRCHLQKEPNPVCKSSNLLKPISIVIGVILILACCHLDHSSSVFAQEDIVEVVSTNEVIADSTESDSITTDELSYVFNNAIIFICAVLVLFMQAGFSMVEVGLNSSKNVVNILFKNLMDLSVGALLFFTVGFALMYPGCYGDVTNAYFSFGGFGIYGASDGDALSPYADWFFQAVFAATAATIVSGAVAGRMRFGSYLIFSAVLTALIYPISGYWKWGGGWLTQFGEMAADGSYPLAFQDFAGSVVVHAVGGFAGLAGALVLGPRIGRFSKEGKPQPMPGHNMTFAALGVFILWVGWYGFNPGSQLAFGTAADIDATVYIAVTTTLAAAAGAIVATFISWIWLGKPDISIGLNGALGGLVGITAGPDCFTPWWSMVIGACAGALVVAGVRLLDRLKIDDPVGAWPVHGLCGIWGCLAIGFIPNAHLESGATTFLIQVIGTVAIVAWAFLTMLALFSILKLVGMLRVSEAEELQGLDMSEHGMSAYPSELPGTMGAAPMTIVPPATKPSPAPTKLAGAE